MDGYNKCYNEFALEFQNKKRKHHETNPLEFDVKAARAIQAEMNRATFQGEMEDASKRDPAYKDCGELVFYEPDPKKLHQVSTTNIVTETWYNGLK